MTGKRTARWAAPFGVDEQHPMLQCEPTPCFSSHVKHAVSLVE